MFRLVRIAVFVTPFVFWLLIVMCFGIYGTYAIACLISATVGGAYLGYYVVSHGMTIGNVPTGRAWGAFALCLFLPAVFCLGANRTTSTVVRSQLQVNENPSEVDSARKIQATLGDFQKAGAAAFGEGRKTAFDPPQQYGRNEADTKPVLIGTGKWRICFQTPGPAMIKTGLSIKQGESYYIKMDREAESIQFGWLGEDRQGKIIFGPAPAPSSALVDSVPIKYTMYSWANNAQLAFNVTTIPDGKYEIVITKSQFDGGPDEYAPGLKPKNRW